MTIDDIIRFFSQNADGQRMAPDNANAGILSRVGDGRLGMDDPRIVRSNDPRPQMAQTQFALSPLATADVQPRPPIAAVMAGEAAMQPTGPAPVSDAVMRPVSQPEKSRGILGFADGNQAMMGIGAALAAAGSSDPVKAAVAIQAQQAEEAKIREARRQAMRPKVDRIEGTPFSRITLPDGTFSDVPSAALAEYYRSQSASKQNAAIEKAVLDDRLARGRDASKSDIKASEEAKPVLNDIVSLKDRWSQAREIISGQGAAAQIQGIPGIAGIAGFFGGDEVAKNKFLEGLSVDETLLNTARTKGAISNQEMTLFKSPIPSITDDREKVWKPWIEKRLEVLDKLEKYYAGEAGRSSGGQAAPSAQSSPPPSDQLRSAVTAAGIPFEPEKFQYRIGPNGQVQRKAK